MVSGKMTRADSSIAHIASIDWMIHHGTHSWLDSSHLCANPRRWIAQSRPEDYAKHLATAGVKSIFICGATGESLLHDEGTHRSLEAWCPFARNHGLKVIFMQAACQVGAVEVEGRVAGCRRHRGLAASLHTARSVDDLVEFMKPIAKACRETPFLFYDNPSRSHVDFPNLVLGEMMASIDNFAGVKLTRCDLESLEQAIDTCGDDAGLLRVRPDAPLRSATGRQGRHRRVIQPLCRPLPTNAPRP